jgi:hypothetical protein
MAIFLRDCMLRRGYLQYCSLLPDLRNGEGSADLRDVEVAKTNSP